MAADSDGEPSVGSKSVVNTSKKCLVKLGGSQLRQLSNTSAEENDLIETVFTCHGNLDDPDFPHRFSHLLDNLSNILTTGKETLMRRVKKIEPWNSVRVTLNIPREAASRLRTLAAAGDAALQALGILSVQVEGDQVISLRLAARFGGDPQEIVLRTGNTPISEPPTTASTSSTMSSTSSVVGALSTHLNSVAGPSSGFRSPNVVAPVGSSVIPPSPRPHSGPSPYPFTSMTHAAQTQNSRQDSPHHNFTAPPPYTSKPFVPLSSRVNQQSPSPSISGTNSSKTQTAAPDTVVSMSSPLLVNLLQTEGKEEVRPATPRVPAPPRLRPSSKTFSPRPGPSRFPPPVVPPPLHRFPSATSPSVPSSTVTNTAVTSVLRPPYNTTSSVTTNIVKEPTTPRSVIQGYSQFTALSSKPCTSSETAADKSEEKNRTADGKKLIINPLTGELEPMPSESEESDEESAKDNPFLFTTSPVNRIFSDEDSAVPRRVDVSDQSDSDAISKSNGSEVVGGLSKRRIATHKLPAHSNAPEKIKLRFMVDKPEPGQPVSAPANAYKVDLSFSPSVRKNISSGNRVTATPSPPATQSSSSPFPCPVSAAEEPRVPPLHISLRGRNATVVSNKKKPQQWLLDDEDEFYSKFNKKKLKLGNTSVKDGRDCVAITNCDLSQKPKRAKMKRLMGIPDGDGLKLKIPVTPDMDVTDLCDEKLSKKRKDSKKSKNNIRHSESDSDSVKSSLKMDSEEWISRTLKEETLRNSVSLDGDVTVPSESAVTENKGDPDVRTSCASVFKPANYELSELLRCKKIESSNKKIDTLKIKNKLMDLQYEEPEPEEEVAAAVKKPQEIGGKIKSELSSKIDRVSGKLKNDLSKDGTSKKKLEDASGKGLKGSGRNKVMKKEGSVLRLGSVLGSDTAADADVMATAFNRTKRRHSGDQTSPECQAQKVKMRSSSWDQPIPVVNRKLKKESVIERLRREKLGCHTGLSDPNNKNVRALINSNSEEKTVEKSENTSGVSISGEVKPVITRLEGDQEKLKDGTSAVEGNTQGEDSGIESMDALSEKSPNQGESPCRKEDSGKEMEDSKKGQNHDRTEEEDAKEVPDNSCLTMGNSSHDTLTSQAHTVPFETTSRNNNTNGSEPDSSTKLKETADEGLIESFETKIREAFRREEDPSREGLGAKILEGSSKEWGKESGKTASVPEQMSAECSTDDVTTCDGKIDNQKDWAKEASPSLEDIERFRVKPPLYTYAKREDSLSPSPTTVEGCDQRISLETSEEETKKSIKDDELSNKGDIECGILADKNHIKDPEDSNSRQSIGRGKIGKGDEGLEVSEGPPGARPLRNKSLLEQLLIEIPPAEDTRRTRSWNKVGSSPGATPKSSPRPGSPSVARPSPRTGSKASPTSRNAKRPSKRKSSENAAELIKACMGVDEAKSGKTVWKKGDQESSDDEPLSDLARSREQSVEQDIKPALLKPKLKQISIDEESRNNNKVAVKVVTDTPTRRSVRQTQGPISKLARTVRSTRSALSQDSPETGNKRRRSSRDGK